MAGKKAKGEGDQVQAQIPGTESGEQEPQFPDSTQLALQGVKPEKIKIVEKEFDSYLELHAKKAKTDGELKDKKERLREVMVEQGVPTYGKKYGKHRWVADTHEKPEITIKKQKADRN